MIMSMFLRVIMMALVVMLFLGNGCHGISDSPSLAPSLSVAPTNNPTVSPSRAPSSFPTVSAAPSTLAPTFPPVVMDKFDWDLERVGDPRFSFTEEFAMEELMIDYNISLREVGYQLFEDDCETQVSDRKSVV